MSRGRATERERS